MILCVKGMCIEDTQVCDLKALSKRLNIGVRTLKVYVKTGKLKAKKIGRSYFVTETSLMDFLKP